MVPSLVGNTVECDGCVSFMRRTATAHAEPTSKRSEADLTRRRKMKRIALLILVSAIALPAQPRRTAGPRELSSVLRQTANFQESVAPRPKSALVDPSDRVFVDVLSGGGWETLMTFVNMSNARAHYTLTFYDDNGNPVNVPLTKPDGSV